MLVSGLGTELKAFDSMFSSVFGGREPGQGFDPEPQVEPAAERATEPEAGGETGVGAEGVSSAAAGSGRDDDLREVALPVAASDEERLRDKRFDALEPGARAAVPADGAARRRHTQAPHAPLRATAARRAHGHATHAARKHARPATRSALRAAAGAWFGGAWAVLCDISGSMEPYARAYLQFLTSAAGSGPNAEAFAFATRLTRLTRRCARARPGARDPARGGGCPTGRAARASATH